MIWQLILTAAGLLLVIGLVLCWPRRQHRIQPLDPKQLFSDKLQLLVEARDSGELSPADFQSAAQELKNQFLGPAADAKMLSGDKNQGRFAALGLVVVLTLGIYAVTGQYQQLAQWQQAQELLPSLGERALLGQGEQLSEQELTLFALGLRTKLANSGDDAVAWFVLGRIWLSQGQVLESLEAFERALKLTPERSNVLLSYAQALLVEGSEESIQKAAQSLGQVLSKEPQNLDALSMLALIAGERGDITEARAAWELVAQLLPADDPRRQSVLEQLAKLPAATPVDTAVSAAAASAGPVVRVALTLSAETAKAHAGQTLFVFARAAQGRPLPVAVKKLTVAAPGVINVELTDNEAMQAGWNLSAAGAVIIGARISQSGSATPDPADLQVKSAPLEPAAGQQVTVALAL